MGSSRSLSIVIPVYNSSPMLERLVERIVQVVSDRTASWELIFVNDGSSDDSWQTICCMVDRHPEVTGIDLRKNVGQQSALLCGIRAASGETVVTLDDDLQNPPEEIPKLLRKLDEGFDVVYGIPIQKQHQRWRNLGSRLLALALQQVMNLPGRYEISSFRAFDRQVCDAFTDYSGPWISIDALLAWGTDHFAVVSVEHLPRAEGASNYGSVRLLGQAIDILVAYTVWPLRFASLLGFLIAGLGFVVLLFVFGRLLLNGGSVPGFPFLASTMAIFSGTMMLALGIVGEYIARIHLRTMGRPSYTVREVRGGEPYCSSLSPQERSLRELD